MKPAVKQPKCALLLLPLVKNLQATMLKLPIMLEGLRSWEDNKIEFYSTIFRIQKVRYTIILIFQNSV